MATIIFEKDWRSITTHGERLTTINVCEGRKRKTIFDDLEPAELIQLGVNLANEGLRKMIEANQSAQDDYFKDVF